MFRSFPKQTLTCTFCKREFDEDNAADMRYFVTHRCGDPTIIFNIIREYEAEFMDDYLVLPPAQWVMFRGKAVNRLEQLDHPSNFMIWLAHEQVNSG